MNSAIVPFVFENNTVRTITDEHGEILFCGKDVAVALGYENPSEAMKYHCKDDGVAKRYPIIDSLGRTQEARFISEPNMLRLIVSSKLESAQRFERWVFEEVLPSIRKTGSYQTRQPVPIAQPTLPVLAVAECAARLLSSVPGVNPAIAAAAALTMIQAETGIDTEPMRRCLPVAQGPTASLNPTRLAKLVGNGVTAQGVNSALESIGLQQKCLRGGWELTNAGREYGEALPFSRNGHSGYQVLWQESVVPELDNYFRDE